ncbi:GNAT family N-acetyltransferase [Xinfangfangia sp. CPCC 101601]|uniref:GNAT family N-acetyltransferase n=1 Tax=Pseudogemmobacter lacusdianii TaxID=3069608 RepID=A0ABU0VYK4_9RHOB|nr:GNAT family N-acetyltransferase [Xinfangfangia sp. CPCC 101601]MDQ2066826.1 GNAT family N-acetyltransferase [Xinfangfangia sp. CPCC 101601]
MHKPLLRRATPGDAATLARLHHHLQSWHAATYPQVFFASPDPTALTAHFEKRLREPSTTCFLAGETEGDPAMGYALCTLQQRPLSLFSPPIRRILIEHIAVAPEARRQGLGAALLQEARRLAHDLSCDEILLDTWEGNIEAHAFFAANGFAPRRMLFRAVPLEA